MRKTVLIVDDEMDMRIFISTLLETSGYRPILTKDGRAGILKAREIVPDLIILDVMMPGEGGVQMYRQLKTDFALMNIPVIMLSGVGKKTFEHYLKMLNARGKGSIPEPSAYLEKPPEADDLIKLTERLIG
jgi:CheY-like chemotaxis protein